MSSSGWTLQLSDTWNVLGPFPIHAREQHFLSPAFPLLDLRPSIDFDKGWPSSYADGGYVNWNVVHSDDEQVKISFPRIRWQALRLTEGWAALQHHALLRTTLVISPPTGPGVVPPCPQLLIELRQGSFLTIVPPHDRESFVPVWYAGNIYGMSTAIPRVAPLPSPPSTTSQTIYDVFVSGDYEVRTRAIERKITSSDNIQIRLFGDPRVEGTEVPTQTISLGIKMDISGDALVFEPSHNVVCDFVDGFAFGITIGLGFRSKAGTWDIVQANLNPPPTGLEVKLLKQTSLCQSQTRLIPLVFHQTDRYHDPDLNIEVMAVSPATGATRIFQCRVPLRQQQSWTAFETEPILCTYLYGQSMPTAFLVVPPRSPLRNTPPIVSLHGAGVEIFEGRFWVDSLPRHERAWSIVPSGRTSWGLDWHGPSAHDVWASVEALSDITNKNVQWISSGFPSDTSVVIIGHSNGGQGAWYHACRFPDRILGVVAAAAYIKSQAYVPLSLSRSAHFIDPALRAILETSLTPDDNDLFLTNITEKPVLAIHGGDDTNVPVWHSREYFGILKGLGSTNVTLLEDAGKDHWYPKVLDNDAVHNFLARVYEQSPAKAGARPVQPFTLTVSAPSESGSLNGWKIEELKVPGRLSRLEVRVDADSKAHIKTTNVHRFTRKSTPPHISTLVVDGSELNVMGDEAHFELNDDGQWKPIGNDTRRAVQPSSRLQTILSSSGSLVLVIPENSIAREQSVAARIAHDLHIYHRLDAEIMSDAEFWRRTEPGTISQGNVVYIGKPSSPFALRVISLGKTPFKVVNGSEITIQGKTISPGLGALFLHPHLTHVTGTMLFMLYTDAASLERIARLFPIRTGVAAPDWLIVGENLDFKGAAGVEGAGVWGRQWSWNDATSILL